MKYTAKMGLSPKYAMELFNNGRIKIHVTYDVPHSILRGVGMEERCQWI
jgi:hypothetical protein